MRQYLLVAALAAIPCLPAHAGPFAPAAGQAGSDAVSKDSTAITNWATGYQDYTVGTDVISTWKTPEKALGKAVGDSYDIVSLGNGGSITLTFGGSIFNGDGADFAIFENSFNDTFLELGRVEVSSNGTDFFRFSAISLTPSAVGAFGAVDPTNISGFAGKYKQGFGTSFDLGLLSGTVGLDINNVQYVRIVDVLGNGTEYDDYPVALGGPHKIYDPYKTVQSAGFDLDAVGIMHFAAAPVPEPEQYAMFIAGLALIGRLTRQRHAARG